jgi:glycosyltransferase involved in cell wall biosynthesis
MSEPLVSVIIPVWNEEKNIERAMRSIMNQTYRNLDIIVVDDGSTDTTFAVAERAGQGDPRVRVVSNPLSHVGKRKNWRGYDINTGATARNHGFSLARGAWITLQDADDASLLNRIEVQVTYAQKYQVTLLSIEWQQYAEEASGKKLDVARFIEDHGGEASVLLRPHSINALPALNKGPLMRLPFALHRFIPFPFKWFPYTRPLFYGKQTPFPGAGNCMMFIRDVIDAGIGFRTRNNRVWGSPTGRGSDRDFFMRVTETYKNTWSLKVPLYLWDVNAPNPLMPQLTNYLI